MTHYLIASVPIHRHVFPLLALAAGLVERGHHVRFSEVTDSRSPYDDPALVSSG